MTPSKNRICCLMLFAVSFALRSEAQVFPPDWSKHAVWYQIFPERFRNGDSGNDPTRESLDGTWPYLSPADWQPSPWTSDWYELQPWEQDGRGFYVHAQLRRYGGDIQGIIDGLDHLQSLGVNALYLNPVFDSASLHKYGATMYHHIDRHFGPDPDGDTALFAKEDPGDPSTWKWSAGDRLFLEMVKEVHRRNMRIIIDGVFNHVGIPFWAFQQAKKEGPSSRYADWFVVDQWDDPATEKDEFDYRGWVGIKDLPEFQKDEAGPVQEVKEHFKAVLARWMDPNGDGDPNDGVDGWRLDVAKELSITFWTEFRGWVKGINPDAYITGEIWWKDYRAGELADASPWLSESFDAVMNYRFGDLVYKFLLHPEPLKPTEFRAMTEQLHADYGYPRILAMQNLFDSHDTSRIGSAVVNPTYQQDHGANLQSNGDYDVRKPNAAEKKRWQQMVAYQFLAPGAPYIYYGDEVGMWGADDPDCRKPMLWEDLAYESETAHPLGHTRPTDSVQPDTAMFEFYRKMVSIRQSHPALQTGTHRTILTDDERKLFGFERASRDTRIVAIFNASDIPAAVDRDKIGSTNAALTDLMDGRSFGPDSLVIPARWFRAFQESATN